MKIFVVLVGEKTKPIQSQFQALGWIVEGSNDQIANSKPVPAKAGIEISKSGGFPGMRFEKTNPILKGQSERKYLYKRGL
jgi:hypothetical protein